MLLDLPCKAKESIYSRMVTKAEKQRIIEDETIRANLRRSPDTRFSKIWLFLNSSFGIFFIIFNLLIYFQCGILDLA